MELKTLMRYENNNATMNILISVAIIKDIISSTEGDAIRQSWIFKSIFAF